MDDKLTSAFSKFLSGWAISSAILDDYCMVISKIEGITPEEVRKRIMKSVDEKFEKAKSELKPDQ